MDRRSLIALLGIITFLLTLSFGLFIHFKNEATTCDTKVEMKDGTTYDCASTISFDSGVTVIRGCNGEKLKVVTNDINKITYE